MQNSVGSRSTVGVNRGCTNSGRESPVAPNMWALSKKLASCHLSGARNFVVPPTLLENLSITVLNIYEHNDKTSNISRWNLRTDCLIYKMFCVCVCVCVFPHFIQAGNPAPCQKYWVFLYRFHKNISI